MVKAHALIIAAVLHRQQNHKLRLVVTAPASPEIGRAGACVLERRYKILQRICSNVFKVMHQMISFRNRIEGKHQRSTILVLITKWNYTNKMTQRLLMIEDDQRLASMVATYLNQNGFEVQHSATAKDGLHQLQQADATQPFAIVLLDLMLPDADGLDVCRQIRAQPQPTGALPIVMLTAKGDPMDRVVGLELGADDYIPKPFEPRELLARLRAVLRRQQGIATAGGERVLRFGRLEIDLDARVIRLDDQDKPVTAYQFNLLAAMADRAGRVLSREQLMDAVKGEPLEAFDRSIDVHIGRLRAAIEDDPKQPKRIITVRGAGYVFAKAQDV